MPISHLRGKGKTILQHDLLQLSYRSIRWIALPFMIWFGHGYQANAQHFGFKGGFNFSTIKGNIDSLEYKYKPGYHFGVLADIRASGNVNIQLEIVYSNQGAWTQRTRDLSVHYDYLNLPINLKLSMSRQLFFELGPQFGFLLRARSKDGAFEVDLTDQVRKIDFAILAGLGYSRNRHVDINGRFNFGMSSLANRQQRREYRSTNQVFQVSLAYLLRP